MRKFLMATAFLAGIAAPSAALAQEKGTWEIGAFARYNDFSDSYEVEERASNVYGFGVRLGRFFSPTWALEFDATGNWTDVRGYFVGFQSTALTYYPFRLRLMFNKRLGGEDGKVSWFLGVGPAHNRYGKNVPGQPGFDGTDWAIAPTMGFRFHLLESLALRLDGTLDYIWNPNNGKDEIVNQFGGITQPAPEKNVNLGAQAGLSWFPNMCNKDRDGTTISPTRATVDVGGTATFTASAIRCGKTDDVVWSLTGPGRLENGRYTASDSGTANVMACGRRNKFCSTATVTVQPPERVVSITLEPASETRDLGQSVTYTITGRTNRGATRSLTNCTLASQGGTVAGLTVSWNTPGMKTVTATCPEGTPNQATVNVRGPRDTVITRTAVGSASAAGRSRYMVDSARIFRQADIDTLRVLAQVLKNYPGTKIAIDGHTDSDGSVAHNEGLGMRRAESVRDFLRSEGVPLDQMTVILRTFGECRPVAGNDREVGGRAVNRRAEIYSFINEADLEPASAQCTDTRRRPLPRR
jgi:outer membrane protein OmpA-like peptidoglycan-associated protein